jgi:sigma-B regulation protein RsbU (phosphoserine phosphatase)
LEPHGAVGVLADVSGKGVAASLLSSMLLGCLQLLLRTGLNPAEALNRLNAFLYEKESGKFATMFLFAVDAQGSGNFISAGHNPAYLYRAASGDVQELPSNCMIVGAFDFATFHTQPLELHPGDILMIYSDGLTEAANPAGEMFGEERVKEIVRLEGPNGAEAVHNAVLNAIEGFTSGHVQTDDVTIMIIQRA